MKQVIYLSIVVAILSVACGEEEGVTEPGPERLEPTSPANVLKNVELAFNNRDVNLLKAMLSENFVFHFDPRDVGQSPPGGSPYVIPESWSQGEFLGAAANMFNKAYRISLTIETDNVGKPPSEATEYRAENVPAELLVMVDELNGYWPYDACIFAFERYLAEGGGKYWRLTEWRDYGSYYDEKAPGIEPSTIGRVLAVYYML